MARSDKAELTTWGEKRSIFLALRNAIRRELETGRSLRSVYVATGADQAMGYSIFTRYVARYLSAESEIQRRGTTKALDPQIPPSHEAPGFALAASFDRPSREAALAARSDKIQKEDNDGPKAPPRLRGFVRLAGLPDDNKDKLI